MNWEIVKWVGGVLLTFAGIKFLFVAWRALFNKESMEGYMHGIGNSIENTGKRIGAKVKNKMEERKERDRSAPRIYIR